MSFVKCLLLDLRRHHFGGPAPKESSSLIFREKKGERKRVGEKQKRRRRWRGRDRVGTNVCCVTGPLQHPWTLGKTQSHASLQKGAMKIFFFYVYKNIFIYFLSLCHLSISCCPSTPCSATEILFDDADMLALPLVF